MSTPAEIAKAKKSWRLNKLKQRQINQIPEPNLTDSLKVPTLSSPIESKVSDTFYNNNPSSSTILVNSNCFKYKNSPVASTHPSSSANGSAINSKINNRKSTISNSSNSSSINSSIFSREFNPKDMINDDNQSINSKNSKNSQESNKSLKRISYYGDKKNLLIDLKSTSFEFDEEEPTFVIN